MTLRGKIAVAAALLVAAGPACGGGDAEGEAGGGVQQSVEVEAFDYYFEPTALAVELGADVTLEFSNAGGVTHSFTAPDLDVEVEASNGADSDVTFRAPDQAGSFDFFCKYHPDEMNGTISIGGGEAPLEEDQDPDGDDADPIEEDNEDDATTEEDGKY